MDRLRTIIKKQSIKPDDISYILKMYDDLIGGEESETYKMCKCPGALRIIIDDLTLWLKNND
jgi:hypothetical protein